MNEVKLGIFCMLVALVGNFLADQATLKDCATNGEARMLGGGVIKCEVKKDANHG